MLAYFDPGSGSMLLQLLVGGTAGIFVFGRFLWQTFTDTMRGHAKRAIVETDSPEFSGSNSHPQTSAQLSQAH